MTWISLFKTRLFQSDDEMAAHRVFHSLSQSQMTTEDGKSVCGYVLSPKYKVYFTR